MAKVFVVTDGCYSDYRICAAFSTHEAAQKYKEALCGYDGRVEEYDLDEYMEFTVDAWVEMDKEGAASVTFHKRATSHRIGADVKLHYFQNSRRFVVNTDDIERAIKVANERRVELIASGKW